MCGLVRGGGLEPLCLAALAPQASASANFATSALCLDAGGREFAVSNPKGSIASRGGWMGGAAGQVFKMCEGLNEEAKEHRVVLLRLKVLLTPGLVDVLR